jgi:DNA polymerase-3 subunit delta
MKYKNISAFQKHLSSAAPHHLCKVYLVAMKDDFERTKALRMILSYFVSIPTRFEGGDCNLTDVLDAMQSMSLLGESIVVLDAVEKLTKKQAQVLIEGVKNLSGSLLLGTRSKTILAEIAEKEGVILDLLEEKSWDREKRLMEQLATRAKNAGKKLGLDVATLLLERIGIDPASLESEIDKLICFVGERSSIVKEDVLQISAASKSSTLWQIAEDVIWEGAEIPSLDTTAFHGLIPALRSQLHLGLSLATLIEEKTPSDEWGKYLPKLWPKVLEKRSGDAARLGSSYFRKGQELLFSIELLSRSNSTQYRALLDLFRAQMYVR